MSLIDGKLYVFAHCQVHFQINILYMEHALQQCLIRSLDSGFDFCMKDVIMHVICADLFGKYVHFIIEPHREKTGFLPRRKQRRRSASR